MPSNKKYVMGIFDDSKTAVNMSRQEKFKELTEFFTRFKYKGKIIVKNSINDILDEAVNYDADYCIIQCVGHLIKDESFFNYIEEYVNNIDFFVTGHIMDKQSKNSANPKGNGYYGLHKQCLLVNLAYYNKFDRPVFGNKEDNEEQRLAKAARHSKDIHDDYTPISLAPTEETCICTPLVDGWNFINTSLKNGLTVYNFHPKIRNTKQYVYPNKSIEELENQLSWINSIISIAPNCVFFWNTEKYYDIKHLKKTNKVNKLYSVAASFKPNMILHEVGFTEDTVVEYYDYSKSALAFKKLLIQHWDGEDYPAFLKWATAKYSINETKGAGTENKSYNELWEREIERWGTEATLKEHWTNYRKLSHNYTYTNIFKDPAAITSRITNDENLIIWWSNAFHTVNAHYTLGLTGVKQAYDNWITAIYEKNKNIQILGVDYLNNTIRSGYLKEYLNEYR
jgi:hypothetical protein